MKHIYKLLVMLILAMFLTSCAPSTDKIENSDEETVTSIDTDSSSQNKKKAAVLTMYYPDGNTENFRFLYDDMKTLYNVGNYYSIYLYEKKNHDIIEIVKTSNGMAFYKELEQDEYKVFSGTFTVQNEPAIETGKENDGSLYKAICDICKQEMVVQ